VAPTGGAGLVLELAESLNGRAPLLPSPPPADAGVFLEMPNIQQQKKRVRLAAEQRIQNLRYRSTAKTLAKRLRDAVDSGNTTEAAEEHKKLISWLDRSAARGAIHKNTAARRKSQADRLISGKSS